MYEIRENATYGSREIYFEGKPSEATRNALKSLKMRWNPTKKCWYGFASEYEMIEAINGAGETVVTEGYMGGGAVYGANSNKHLYGAELSAEVRNALKAAGIKGASVKIQSYSGGQHLYITVKTTEADLVPLDEYIANYRVKAGWGWIWTGEESIHVDAYYSMEAEAQEATRVLAATADYNKALKGQDINQYHIDSYTVFKPEFINKLEAINSIVSSYRYDASNSMVDYFDTNFYYTIKTKAAA